MSFSDDEQNVPSATLSEAGPKPTQLLGSAKRVRLAAYSKDKAPLEKTRLQVMLELVVDASSAGDRSGLDLVAVLDVSGSMVGERIDKMKTAMHFVISKLSPIDRLSIVSFSTKARRLRPLRFMTEAARAEFRGDVDGLQAGGWTNMRDGLQTGLDVLARRRLSGSRAASVILMSDGWQNLGGDARDVKIGNLAVHTFGFGAGHDATLLETIASNSHGGTFNFVRDEESLSAPFSQILAGLLSVVVQDLKLTMRTLLGHSTIEEIDAGSYPKEAEDADARSVTVSFGDLYNGEVRKVIVDLLLPAVQWECRTTAIIAQCSYSTQGEAFYSRRLSHFIRRTRSAVPVAEPPAVEDELARRRHAKRLREAAITMEPDRAKEKLEEARNALDTEQPSPMIAMLRAELEKILKLTKTELLACLLAAILSHYRQRFAARGDAQEIRLFDTPRMRNNLEQANKFADNPTVQPPSVDDDVKEEEKESIERPVTEPDQPRREESIAMERPVPDEPRPELRIWGALRERIRSSGWAWVMVILCTALAIGVIVAGVAVFAVYLLYLPKMPYLVVSDAQLGQLLYAQDGTIQSLQVSITILAENINSKADASFSHVDLALAFYGADVALLQAEPFVVPRESSMALQYNVVSAGPALDAAEMQSMDESLNAGLVPLDLFGKARTQWKVGIFVKRRFWTRITCRLRFFFPGNGTVMPTDVDRCRSRSP